MNAISKCHNSSPYKSAYDSKTKCGNVLISFKTLKFEFVCTLCQEDCNYSTFYELFDHVTNEHTTGPEYGDPPISVNGDPETGMMIEDPLGHNIFYVDCDEIKSEDEEDKYIELTISLEEVDESADIVHITSIATDVPNANENIVKEKEKDRRCYIKRKNVHCNISECKERDPTRRRDIIKLIEMYRKCVGLWHTKTESRTSGLMKTTVRRLLAEAFSCSIPQIRRMLSRMTTCFNTAWKANAKKDYRPWYYDDLEFLKFADVVELPDEEFGDFLCPFCTDNDVIASGSMELWNHITEYHRNVGDLTDSVSNLFLWPTEHILRFIRMYREQECLWNYKCREYYDRPLRDKAYLEIIEKFNEIRPNALTSREIIVESIRYLRIYFRRVEKKFQVSNLLEPETAEEIENDKIFEELLFLKDVLKPNIMHFNETFSCELCEKTFNKKHLFLEHFKLQHKDSAFKCDKCPMVFGSSDNLISHRSAHDKGDGKTYTCPVCRLDYANSNDLEAHLFNHVPNRLLEQICEICGAKFKDRNNLVIHLKRHSNIKNYSCEVCQKRFVTSTELKLHSFMHTDEKTFVCEVCGLGFKFRHHMVNHHRVHEEPRFKCKDCDKKFLTKTHLTEHEKVHEFDGRPLEKYLCDLCLCQFKNPRSLGRHTIRAHNIRKRDICDKSKGPLRKKPTKVQNTCT